MDSYSDDSNEAGAKQAEQKMLKVIRSGEAKIRPRWRFILQTVGLVVSIFAAVLILLYLASFIIFILRETGVWFAPTFGAPGWYSFFSSLPWILILILILFMVLLALLIKRYPVVYERPSMYLFMGVILIVILGGLLIAATPFHKKLFEASRAGGLPVLGNFYRGYGMHGPDDIHRGVIIATTTNGVIIKDENGQTSTVLFNGIPPQPGGDSGSFLPGREIVIFGPRNSSGSIDARGIAPDVP